ncbi:hypothetical protein BGX30_003610 [Mortierella sp. GBA39]|nr:hypothetical protein BGX30_003610 [Mortierella sp. GBA39]
MPDDLQAMGDEQVGQPQLLLQVLQQIDDLGLNRYVQRRYGFVGENEPRVQGDRAGDADPLPLPAGELVRIPLRPRWVESHQFQQLADAAADVSGGALPLTVHFKRLGDAVADLPARIQRSVRILEDRLHMLAGGAQFTSSQVRQVLAVKKNRPCRGTLHLEQDPAQRRLTAAGLADQAESFTLADRKADVVHGTDQLLRFADASAMHRVILFQVIYGKQSVRRFFRCPGGAGFASSFNVLF